MAHPGIIKVFVSSTWLDLGPERRALEFVLEKFEETKLIGMEHFGSRDEGPREVSLEEVGRSDLYIGIIGRRYGSGITEAEYEQAAAKQLPCLLYVQTSVAVTDDDSTDEQLRRFVK